MTPQNKTTFAAFVAERFGGQLQAGSHRENGAACAFEAWNVFCGRACGDRWSIVPWTPPQRKRLRF